MEIMDSSRTGDRPGPAFDGEDRRWGAPEPHRRLTGRSGRRRAHGTPLLALLLAVGIGLSSAVPIPAAPTATVVARSTEPGALIPRKQVVRRALRTDASQEYLLYVPARGGDRAPIFVTAHGISRNVEEHAARFAPYAERHGVVMVAPCFTQDGHDDYQRLGRKGRGRRADQALDKILEEVQALTRARAESFYLFGFSGGAQFAHRYILTHPDRVAAAVVAAAGWYTFPDSGIPYPYGIGRSDELEGVRFDPDAFLRVPITVLVGGADTGNRNLRRDAKVDRQQGTTRRARAQNWAGAMRRAAEARGQRSLVTLEQVPGIEHSFTQFMLKGGLGDRVFGALFGPATSMAPLQDERAPGRQTARSR